MESDIPEWLSLDATSPHPPYEQLRQLIVEAANSGRIAVGVRLPPVRTLAAHLGVAANTVARAYRELERAQIVVTRSRAGTVSNRGVSAARRPLRTRPATVRA